MSHLKTPLCKRGKVNLKEYVLPKPIGEIKDFVKVLPTN